MGVDLQINSSDKALAASLSTANPAASLSPRSSPATVKWDGDAYQNNPYSAIGCVQPAQWHLGVHNVKSVENFNCGGRTHLHVSFGGESVSFTFSGRNETTGVLKLVGRVPLSEERIVSKAHATTPGKWRNTAVRVLIEDILESGSVRLACVKVSAQSVECLRAADERPVFQQGMRLPTLRLGSKH